MSKATRQAFRGTLGKIQVHKMITSKIHLSKNIKNCKYFALFLLILISETIKAGINIDIIGLPELIETNRTAPIIVSLLNTGSDTITLNKGNSFLRWTFIIRKGEKF
jgi:hypothetical protein